MANAQKQNKLKIKKGDQVVVLTGRDKGSKGEVLKVLTDERRVVVQGINMVTKHNKPSQFAAGGIEKKELSIHVSNVALADPKDGVATRVGYKTLKDGKKVRVAKKSGETVE
ncbi:MAG: 50S ribosomal protein L24 [Micavibrio sp.]|nr:50S ribosomal protein L24 [Micavibrio sp.]